MEAPPFPTQLSRVGHDGLRIAWNDGQVREYTARELREACPCATCREKRTQPQPSPTALPILSPAEARPLALAGLRPVGNYAYAVAFSDGHDTGIFSLELLRRLGRAVAG